MFFILTVVLIVALIGSIPKWPHSKGWGYYPSAGVAIVLLVLLFLFLAHRL
jgi:low affinity Fe/Cu permease